MKLDEKKPWPSVDKPGSPVSFLSFPAGRGEFLCEKHRFPGFRSIASNYYEGIRAPARFPS